MFIYVRVCVCMCLCVNMGTHMSRHVSGGRGSTKLSHGSLRMTGLHYVLSQMNKTKRKLLETDGSISRCVQELLNVSYFGNNSLPRCMHRFAVILLERCLRSNCSYGPLFLCRGMITCKGGYVQNNTLGQWNTWF